jgi:hypothetical protein
MTSDTDLSQQPDTRQHQPPLIEKRINSSWVIFSILLIVINLLILLYPLFLLPLVIIDSIAVVCFIRKKPPPWKTCLISLFALNVIFFYIARWALSLSGGETVGVVIIPIALFLLLIDSIAVSVYIYMHLHSVRAKIIFYTALASILLGLLALSIFYSGHP